MQGYIYKIINIKTKKVYIGQTKNLAKRKYEHFYFLRNGKHTNKHLQNSFNIYGEDSFIFELIETVKDSSDLTKREQYWIDQYRKKNLYNIVINVTGQYWLIRLICRIYNWVDWRLKKYG